MPASVSAPKSNRSNKPLLCFLLSCSPHIAPNQLARAPPSAAARPPTSAMELFPDGAHVRLRSRVRGAYLHAAEDGVGVYLSPRRASVNVAWRVHRIVRDGNPCVLLHGAAYGRYLAATDRPAASDHLGHRVVQGVYDHPEEIAVVWQVVEAGDGDGDDVLLRHIVGDRLLRANGRHRLWLTGVTVDHQDNRSTMMHWVVEALQLLDGPPVLPAPIPHAQQGAGGQASGRFHRLFRGRIAPMPQRTIRYVRANYYGNFNDQGWDTFVFQGRSIFVLRMEVAYLVGIEAFFFNITLCTRAGRYGRLTPLTIDLPRSHEPMDIIAFTTGSPVDRCHCAATDLRLEIARLGLGARKTARNKHLLCSAALLRFLLSCPLLPPSQSAEKPTRPPPAMELFPNGAHVRLRSRVRDGMYLHADEDGAGVSLIPVRASLNAAWRVHRIIRDGATYILLHGAAYGRYLAATNERAPFGIRGKRVVQGVYDDPNEPAVVWRAVGAGNGVHVLLRHINGNRLLRANGRHFTWNTGVSVDHPNNESTMMHWVVEPIQPLPGSPNLQPPATGAFPPLPPTSPLLPLVSICYTLSLVLLAMRAILKPVVCQAFASVSDALYHLILPVKLHDDAIPALLRAEPEPPVELQRTIRFVRADANGNFNEQGWGTFQFDGRSVYNLRSQVARHAHELVQFHRIMVCTRAGRYGRLTPLTTDLPRNQEQMDVISLTARSPATQDFQYPNVDAP
ncbi:hypothetical protein PR202_gb17815 [Eleusine coracana subsp. coracana]|uniref:DUF569 domain-containing protein n=1 Tax=Eleusine coracana subsp. coracana TaxID=191504 RepID=A0AAV5F1N3_ELECO|nr:hypothetical protein PR202_gb17815 [Eleusine coracana subsp. coracana]